MDKWYVAELKKMINWEKVKADGATPAKEEGPACVVGPGTGEAQTHPTKAFQGGDGYGWRS